MANLTSTTIYGTLTVTQLMSVDGTLNVSGGDYPHMRFGLNYSSQYLYIGGGSQSNLNTTHATIGVTSGNLHLDPANGSGLYLNHYSGGNSAFVNGNMIFHKGYLPS